MVSVTHTHHILALLTDHLLEHDDTSVELFCKYAFELEAG